MYVPDEFAQAWQTDVESNCPSAQAYLAQKIRSAFINLIECYSTNRSDFYPKGYGLFLAIGGDDSDVDLFNRLLRRVNPEAGFNFICQLIRARDFYGQAFTRCRPDLRDGLDIDIREPNEREP